VLPVWAAEVKYEEGVLRTLRWFEAEIASSTEFLSAPAPVLLNARR